MTQVSACTVITRNRLAHARVLAESFLEHHPSGTAAALVIDDLEREVRDEPFEIVRPEDLELDAREFRRMAGIYNALELSCAMKPWVLSHVLRRSDEVVYLDADIKVFAPITEAVSLARESSIVLTPHYTEPPGGEGHLDSELEMLKWGTYNCGFLAVSRKARPFLSWWKERVARRCLNAVDGGHFVDQKWVDLVPSYFDHALIRDPGWNVAFWNLATRDVTNDGTHYRVNGSPLIFFHFSGFDAESNYVLSRFYRPKPAVLLSEEPALAQLCRDYETGLRERGCERAAIQPYGLDRLPNGMAMNGRMRALYRQALLKAEQGQGEEPPAPYDPDETEAFIDWLRSPSSPVHASLGLTRYLVDLWEIRADLKERFPDLLGAHAAEFLAWVTGDGASVVGPPHELLEPSHPIPLAWTSLAWPDELRRGVLLFRCSGAGDHALVGDRIETSLLAAGVPITSMFLECEADIDDPLKNADGEALAHDTVVLCVPVELLSGLAFFFPERFFAERLTVSVALTENEKDVLLRSDLVAEIWGLGFPPERAVQTTNGRRVRSLPAPLGDVATDLASATNGRGPPFVFLAVIDALHADDGIEVIRAYERAFPETNDVRLDLLLLLIGVEEHLADLERLRLASPVGSIQVHADRVEPADRRKVLVGCDCFVALRHDSASPLWAAEAASLEKPLVAAGTLGGCLGLGVDAYFPVSDRDPAPEDRAHLRPHIGTAAVMMRRVREDSDAASERARVAASMIRSRGNPRSVGLAIDAWIAEAHAMQPVEQRTGRAAGDAPPTSRSAVERAIVYIQQGPSEPFDAPSRYGALGRLARRASLRLLRPYTSRRHELDVAVTEAIADLNHRVSALEGRPGNQGTTDHRSGAGFGSVAPPGAKKPG